MPLTAYSFLLRRAVPLLSEPEWGRIAPLLADRADRIAAWRRDTGASLADAARHEPEGQRALDLYRRLTGGALDHPDPPWAVRLSRYGALCPSCGRPFRTPRARLCAECGHARPAGAVAGPLAPEAGAAPAA